MDKKTEKILNLLETAKIIGIARVNEILYKTFISGDKTMDYEPLNTEQLNEIVNSTELTDAEKIRLLRYHYSELKRDYNSSQRTVLTLLEINQRLKEKDPYHEYHEKEPAFKFIGGTSEFNEL